MEKPKPTTGPSLKPHRAGPFAWWYEDELGIDAYVRAERPDGTHISTERIRIPWHRLLKAAKRCGR